MKAELIFYLSNKTNQNQEQLSKNLSKYGVKLGSVSFATDYSSLASNLKKALSRNDMIFIVGGLLKLGPTNIIRVLSKALAIPLSSDYPPILKGSMLLGDMNFNSGCIVESETQSITVLPDNPYSIRSVFCGKLENFLMKKFYLIDVQKEHALAAARKDIKTEKLEDIYSTSEKVVLSTTTIDEILAKHSINLDEFSDDDIEIPKQLSQPQAVASKKPKHEKKKKTLWTLLFFFLMLVVLFYIVTVSIIAMPTLQSMISSTLTNLSNFI